MYPLKLWDSAIDMVTLGTERGLADRILGLADKWPNNFVVSADLSELVRVAMEDGNKENILAPSCGFMSYLFIALSVSDLAFAVVQNPKKFLGISEGEEELDYDMYDVESELHRWSNIFHELEKYMLRDKDNQLELVVDEAEANDFFDSDDFFYTNTAGNVQSYLDEADLEGDEGDDDNVREEGGKRNKTINGNKASYLHFVHQLGLTADRMSSRSKIDVRSKIDDKVKDIYMRVRFSKETRTFGLTYWLRGVRFNTHRALVEFLGGWTETTDDKQLDPPRDGGYFTLHDILQLRDRQMPDRPDAMDIAMEIAIGKKRKLKDEQKDKDDQTLAEMQANL